MSLTSFLETRSEWVETRMMVDGRETVRAVLLRASPDGLHTSAIAVERANKPSAPSDQRRHGEPCGEGCTFSPGNLAKTTPRRRMRHALGAGQTARTFPNLYPFLEAGCVTVTPRHPTTIQEIDQG